MDIRHDEKEQKFFLEEQGLECSLIYKELSDKLWNFISTSVPENTTGKALINQMIEYAIEFVKANDIKILASCKDVQDYLVNHKSYKDIVYHPY